MFKIFGKVKESSSKLTTHGIEKILLQATFLECFRTTEMKARLLYSMTKI